MMLKMPGPTGVISLHGDVRQALTCDRESCDIAQEKDATKEQEAIRRQLEAPADGEVPSPKASKLGAGDVRTKKIILSPDEPTKTAVIGSDLDCK